MVERAESSGAARMENSLGLRPPANLCLDSNNLAKSWKTWKEEFMLYKDLTLADAGENVRLKVFSYLIGETGRELCETLIPSSSPDRTVDRLIRALEEHCSPKVNETVERATELSRENSRTIEGRVTEEVLAVKHAVRKDDGKSTVNCKFCGKVHERSKKKCPAYGKKCKKCGKDNHFAALCKTKMQKERTVHTITESDEESYEDILCVTVETVNTVTEDKRRPPSKLFAAMLLGKEQVKFQLDCGASCNIIPVNLLNPSTQIEKTEKVLVMYNRSTLQPLGKCKVKLRNPRNKKLYRVEFMVVDEGSAVPLLGSRAVQAMNLVKVQYENIMAVDSIVTEETVKVEMWSMDNIKKTYADVFQGDGCLEGVYRMEVDSHITPVKLPKRRVPVAMMAPLKAELSDLHQRGIITPVDCSTEWISSLVIVRKPSGNLRICIDPRPLNRALKRCHFPLPTIDDILPDLSRAKVFTVCDVKNGFWHVTLDEESSYLTTFATPYGRYRWLRMPMGISPAPEVFQRKLSQALEGLQGIYVIADDILITGEGETWEKANQDHDDKLRALLNRCREKSIKLNVEKFQLRRSEVPYIGHLLTADGLRVDPEKVRAVRDMPRPVDVKGVQRFLGMINYLSKFCDHLSDGCEILRQLTHEDSMWEWTDVQEQAFTKLKDAITKAPILKYYNPEETLTLQCDASETGLGAALLQMGVPIAYGSRALTPTERGYAQIEKECLAIVYGMEKFHQYTYGRKVTVHSDHKPLENIIRKPLLNTPKRLQRMLLRLQRYDIEVTYIPGKDMLLADTLSRSYLPEHASGDSVEMEIESINMVHHIHIAEERFKAIREETSRDRKLQSLIKVIQDGWPMSKKDLPRDIAHYHSFQEELSTQSGVVFRGERVVIPDNLRGDIVQRIHSSHLGIEGCLRRARECVYWLGMNDQIKTFVEKCDICRSMDVKQPKETLWSHELPSNPWSKVGTDIFTLDNRSYLITVDYLSNFWELDYLPDTKSTTVIQKLKAHFARHGIPDVVVSDNGPQYASEDFKKFSRQWEFKHKTSSPGYPQSNGMAESAVKTAKRLLKKAKADGKDPYLSMLDQRNTPSQGIKASPAQRLFSRRTRTLMPMHDNLLHPKVVHTQQGQIENRKRQAAYYNRHAKDLGALQQGDRVRIQPGEHTKAWTKATVVKPVDHRSYDVQLDSGNILRRNRRHLRKDRVTTAENTKPGTGNSDPTMGANPVKYAPVVAVTKSGRKVVRPHYLKDYIQ
ncbi:uncharacterized protein K02A2.6-like isoform X2 [Denticeps clupeoides]|uniref:uncharacterized protein K02A2.6-like isoform X2 n=1 Tax=Denticeps clupeoides TaxID=299321 RepID=UPI0010A4E58A|nr:uncharacterized protein K02A2.6-like isoform X2 [Denticeps clupeoides]